MIDEPAVTAGERLPPERRKDGRRWWFALAFALCLHGAAAAALQTYWRADEDQVAGAPLIMIELAALPAAPDVTPSDAPPGPQQPQTTVTPTQQDVAKRDPEPAPEKSETPERIETVLAMPEPQPEHPVAALPSGPEAEQPVATIPPPKAAESPQRTTHRPSRAQVASAPSTAAHRAERTAAAAPATSIRNSQALPNWKSALVNRLERYKRYPAEAQARGERGVAQLAFSVDRGGGVHRARIVRSSGSHTLDRATLSLIERAQPLPPPPPEMRGAQIAIVVPIRYDIR
jgi:periplasmic protein TonB